MVAPRLSVLDLAPDVDPHHVQSHAVDQLFAVLAEAVALGEVDHVVAVLVAARLTGDRVFVLADDYAEVRALAIEHGVDRNLLRWVDPFRGVRGCRPRLWLATERALRHRHAGRILADLRLASSCAGPNPLCH